MSHPIKPNDFLQTLCKQSNLISIFVGAGLCLFDKILPFNGNTHLFQERHNSAIIKRINLKYYWFTSTKNKYEM